MLSLTSIAALAATNHGSGQGRIRTLKQTRVDQIMLSGILPVKGHRGQGYRNCLTIAINMLVQQIFREKEVGFVDFWGCFFGMTSFKWK